MNKKNIRCICGDNYAEIDLKNHIRKCLPFIKRFKLFDYKIAKLLEEYLSEKENIFLVRFLFKRYIKRIDHKIKKYLYEIEINKNKYKEQKNEENKKELMKNPIKEFNEELHFSQEKNYTMNIVNIYNDNLMENNINKINNDNNISQANTQKIDIRRFNDKYLNENNKIYINNNNKRTKSKSLFSSIFSKKTRCKYCNNTKDKNEICQNKKCREILNIACEKVLSCGHDCLGVRNEINCPPCLKPKCKEYNNLFNQNIDTSCQICFEKLITSPIVFLSCNHYIHYFCIIKKLKEGENLYGKKLDFNFIKCPVCDTIFECPSVPEIQKQIEKYKKIYIKVTIMIEQRIIYNKIDNNKNPLDQFIFYICFKCNNPYYAGINNNYNNNRYNQFYSNKEDFLCGKDSFLYNAKGESLCKKHGYKYIEYKCKFCCKIASRFCSQIHFCEECYSNRNLLNDEICKIKICDKDVCEFNGMHAPNGIEYCLGCFICRLENFKTEYPIFTDN